MPTELEDNPTSFAETALTLGGKSAEEARRTGAVDRADEQVERLFTPEHQTNRSPAHRAVWDRGVPVSEFTSTTPVVPPEVQRVMEASLAIARRHVTARTLFDSAGKVGDEVLAELAAEGYWGLLVDKDYGGSGAPFAAFAPFLGRMATIDGTVAGLASIHGCIGAVDPVQTFGTPEQRAKFLPRLASGESLSGFALTEPCAGSDLTALCTTARLEGDQYIVHGEKLFISNAALGRTVGLVCLIDERPAVLIVDLPSSESDQFQLKTYGLHALRHLHNRGLVFNGLRVPAENRLTPPRGDGLTIAYHGLNRGRVTLCANAAGSMRQLLASMIPWAKFRVTYGAAIEKRELVQRRIGELAGLIVGADSLVAWCSELLDKGYRGEMECIVAKIFGSEALKHAAIELAMKTHGGRSFLHGHPVGDNLHDFLAPCIYEGEGEMLSMSFFKSLVKQHGQTYFEPIGKTLAAAGIKNPNPLNPRHALVLARVARPYLRWQIAERLRWRTAPELPAMPAPLRRRAEFACDELQRMSREIDGTLRKFQLKLADRQCRMTELSRRCQDLIVMLCSSLYAARQSSEVVHHAAEVLGDSLRHRLANERPDNKFYRRVTQLGEAIAEGGFPGLEEIVPSEILMRY